MWMGGPLWPPAVALGLDIRALHRRAATRAPTPPNSSPAPTRDLSLGHSLFLLLLSLMPIGEDKPSPLLWTTWPPARSIVGESCLGDRYNGLSSPWSLAKIVRTPER